MSDQISEMLSDMPSLFQEETGLLKGGYASVSDTLQQRYIKGLVGGNTPVNNPAYVNSGVCNNKSQCAGSQNNYCANEGGCAGSSNGHNCLVIPVDQHNYNCTSFSTSSVG